MWEKFKSAIKAHPVATIVATTILAASAAAIIVLGGPGLVIAGLLVIVGANLATRMRSKSSSVGVDRSSETSSSISNTQEVTQEVEQENKRETKQREKQEINPEIQRKYEKIRDSLKEYKAIHSGNAGLQSDIQQHIDWVESVGNGMGKGKDSQIDERLTNYAKEQGIDLKEEQVGVGLGDVKIDVPSSSITDPSSTPLLDGRVHSSSGR